MNAIENSVKGTGSMTKTAITAVGFLAVVIILMMALMGTFNTKISETPTPSPPGRLPDGIALHEVVTITVPDVEQAAGSIRAVHEAAIASKLLAKVIEVNVIAGQRVQRGDVLVRLDDADLQARLEQTSAAVNNAKANLDQAQIEYNRVQGLIEKQATTDIEIARVNSALKSAKARHEQALQQQNEARTILSYATLYSPIDGVVVDKKVEEGDTVTPSQVLVTLYDPKRMQLVANVRESLATKLDVGQQLGVEIESLDKRCVGTVSEIVPQADVTSRSFTVKVTGPCPPGIYSGMFGRLLVPIGKIEVLVIPESAIQRVGQLDVVYVAVKSESDERLYRRAIRLGKRYGDLIEVLAGLKAGEWIALNAFEVVKDNMNSEGD